LNTKVHAFTTTANGRMPSLVSDDVTVFPAFDPVNDTHLEGLKFKAIWDTGATGSVISKKVATDSGLKPIAMAIVHTAGGTKNCPVYLINMRLPNGMGIAQIRVTEGELAGDIDVLIGMDVISEGDFAVTHLNGKTVFTFRMPSVVCIDFVKEINSPLRPVTLHADQKTGRNQPCPCGSGKKYKRCHGK